MDKLKFYNFGPKLYNKLIISNPSLSVIMFSVGVGQPMMNFPQNNVNQFGNQYMGQRQNGRRNFAPVQNVQNNYMWNGERMKVSKFDRDMNNGQYYK